MDEIVGAGIPREKAEELMRLKLRFAFGHIRDTNDLLSSRVVERELVEIRNGVCVRVASVLTGTNFNIREKPRLST